jgi:hypothetical protein
MEGSWKAAVDNPGGALSFVWLVEAAASSPKGGASCREFIGFKDDNDSGLLTGGYYKIVDDKG